MKIVVILFLSINFYNSFSDTAKKSSKNNLEASFTNKVKLSNSNNLKNEFTFEKYEFDAQRFSKFYRKKLKQENPAPDVAGKIDNLRASLYRNLNDSSFVTDGEKFRHANRKWDYKILDKQLEEIFSTMLYKREDRMTINGVRNYMEIFMNQYQNCDKDNDNVLNLSEFTSCMTTDPYLLSIIPTPALYVSNKNYTTPAVFYAALFQVLDERFENYVNFVGYMRTRLMAYSWRTCSIMAPYLEEVDFECAIEIAAHTRTVGRSTARNIFKLALDLSNNPTIRNIDFVSYFIIANTIRLYGAINGKEDNDISRSEFNLALDDNLLPIRYNQDTIDQLFRMLDDYDKPNQGIDLMSFIYYDFFLSLFTFNNKKRPYFLSQDDLYNVMVNPLFPNKTLNEIYFIPQYTLTTASYQMYQYINITQFIPEGDYLYKFLEISSEVENTKFSKNQEKIMKNEKLKNYPINPLYTSDYPVLKKGVNKYNTTFDLRNTVKLIFETLDYDTDGWINFYDFGTFMQIASTFARSDEFNKGKLAAGVLYDLYKNYADYPMISYRLRERAERFNNFDQNIYVDLLSAIEIMKIDDVVRYYNRKVEHHNVYEIELRKALGRVNMKFLPDTYLHRCMRGVDYNTLPRYDWECSFIEGMKLNLKYFEAMNNYKTIQVNNLTMLSTVFYNVDPPYV